MYLLTMSTTEAIALWIAISTLSVVFIIGVSFDVRRLLRRLTFERTRRRIMGKRYPAAYRRPRHHPIGSVLQTFPHQRRSGTSPVCLRLANKSAYPNRVSTQNAPPIKLSR